MSRRCHNLTLLAAAIAGAAACMSYASLANTLAHRYRSGPVLIEPAHVVSPQFGERDGRHVRHSRRPLNDRYRLERRTDRPGIDIEERSRIRIDENPRVDIDENPTIKIDEGRPLTRP